MADRILYSIPEMKQAGANFHAKAEEINDILNYLNSEIENLESVFDGAAQDSLFAKYQELAGQEKNVIFGGRLGNYKYYDMDKVIKSALEKCKEVLEKT